MIRSIFLAVFLFTGKITCENPCGDWEPYKDEKCLKIFESSGLLSYEDAQNFCKSAEQSNLVSIGLEEKQKYLEAFLRSNNALFDRKNVSRRCPPDCNVVDNAWIGFRYINNSYQWTDGSEPHYLNWAAGSPRNDSDYCVQIETDDTYYGQWSEVSCSKKNLVICEKIQVWSANYLQNKLIELTFSLDQSKQTEKDLYAKIEDLHQNPVPIGFIYVQLPKEKSPMEIWSWMEWEDISSNYEGLFFRTVGGKAAEFGQEQAEDSPRLIQAQALLYHGHEDLIDIHADGQFSKPVHTAFSDEYGGITFKVSSAEVRPRNMAVKIWRRLK